MEEDIKILEELKEHFIFNTSGFLNKTREEQKRTAYAINNILEYLKDISKQLDNIAIDQIPMAISESHFFRARYKDLLQENKNQKEALNQANKKILAQKGQLKVLNERNKISEEETQILEAYRKYKEVSGSNGWIICNPNTMWSEYFIPISVIQNKIDYYIGMYEIGKLHEDEASKYQMQAVLAFIEDLQNILEERNK